MIIKTNLIYSNKHKLRCDLYRPESLRPAPVVVLVPGGGWKEADKSLRAPAAIALAQAGFAALAIEYRTAPQNVFPAPIEDILEVFSFISNNSERLGFQKGNLAIMGISAGGQLAALAGVTKAVQFPELKAVVTYHAPMDLEAYSSYDSENLIEPRWAQKLVSEFLGDEYFLKARLASPLHQVNKDAVPLLAIASKEDGSVPWEQSERTVHALENCNVKSEFLLHPGSEHSDICPEDVLDFGWEKLWEPEIPRRLLFHSEVVQFLRNYLMSG